MRSTRFRKFRRRNQTLKIILKSVLVVYLLVFTTSYITSNTTAYYSSQQSVSELITAGDWEQVEAEIEVEEVAIETEVHDSHLSFINDDNQMIDMCEPTTIKVWIENNGQEDMLKDGTYEIYYSETGDPKETGSKLEFEFEFEEEEGIIEALVSREKVELIYDISKPGVYIFLTYQEDGASLWSEEILVICDLENTVEDEEIEEEETNVIEKEPESGDSDDHEEKGLDESEENITDQGTESEENNETSADLEEREDNYNSEDSTQTDDITNAQEGEED